MREIIIIEKYIILKDLDVEIRGGNYIITINGIDYQINSSLSDGKISIIRYESDGFHNWFLGNVENNKKNKICDIHQHETIYGYIEEEYKKELRYHKLLTIKEKICQT